MASLPERLVPPSRISAQTWRRRNGHSRRASPAALGAAASSEPPPDVVEACVTLESGDVEEILSVFLRAASCASPTNGFGGDASLQTTPRALAGRVVALDATVPGLDPDDPRTCEALGLSQALGRAAASLAMNDAADADVRPTALRARHLVTLAARCKSAEARAGLARDIFATVGPERALRDLAILAVGESEVASDPLAGIALASLARALVDRDDLPRQIARRCPAAWDTLRALVQPSLRRIARPPSWRTLPASLSTSPATHPVASSPRSSLGFSPGACLRSGAGRGDALRLGRRRPQFPDVSVAGRRPRPALVAVRTRAGDVLGGVSSESLTSKPEFFGDARSFVFALGRAEPDRSVDRDPPAEVGAHPASGRNENFAWCASGFASERFPNGIGFGGQVGHHSVWIDSDFEAGHSRSSAATFGAPRLLSGGLDGAFRVDAIEAWGLAPPPEPEPGSRRRGVGGGVLGAKHAEARMLMETARRDAGGPERQER